MITLRLVPAPSGSATPSTGGALPKGRVFRSRLTQTRKTMTLQLGQWAPAAASEDYDALQVGSNNLLVGTDRIMAVP